MVLKTDFILLVTFIKEMMPYTSKTLLGLYPERTPRKRTRFKLWTKLAELCRWWMQQSLLLLALTTTLAEVMISRLCFDHERTEKGQLQAYTTNDFILPELTKPVYMNHHWYKVVFFLFYQPTFPEPIYSRPEPEWFPKVYCVSKKSMPLSFLW